MQQQGATLVDEGVWLPGVRLSTPAMDDAMGDYNDEAYEPVTRVARGRGRGRGKKGRAAKEREIGSRLCRGQHSCAMPRAHNMAAELSNIILVVLLTAGVSSKRLVLLQVAQQGEPARAVSGPPAPGSPAPSPPLQPRQAQR